MVFTPGAWSITVTSSSCEISLWQTHLCIPVELLIRPITGHSDQVVQETEIKLSTEQLHKLGKFPSLQSKERSI